MARRLIAVLLFAGCSSPIRVPTFEGAQSAVLVVERPSGVRAFAHDLVMGSEALRIPLADDTERMTLFLHRRTLEALQLTAGEIDLAPAGAPSRPLPNADALHESGPEGDWRPIMTPPPSVSALRLPREGFEACVAHGGCLADHEAEGICEPCPAPLAIAPPRFADEPDKPKLEPCPAGWIAGVISAGEAGRLAPACSPYPAGVACGAGEVILPGDAACRSIGPPCPHDAFADVQGPAIYVVADAPPGGDGTRGAPLRELDAALIRVMVPEAIVIGAGMYTLQTALPANVRVVGACAEVTLITGRVTGGPATISGATIMGDVSQNNRALVLQGVDLHGRVDARDSSITLERSRVGGSLRSFGSHVAIIGTRIEGTLELHSATASITASVVTDELAVRDGSRISVERSFLGPMILDGSTGDIQGSAVSGAIGVLNSSRATLSLVQIGGTLAIHGGGDVVANDVVIDPPGGYGILVAGSDLTLNRAFIARATGAGIFVEGTDAVSRVEIRDAEIVAVGPRPGTFLASGVHLQSGDVILSRVLIEDTGSAAIKVEGDAGTLEVSDVRIHRTGDAVRLDGTRRTTLERVALVGVRGQAIIAGDARGEPTVEMTDVSIEGTVVALCVGGMSCPIASLVLQGGSIHGTRVSITHSADIAIRAGRRDLVLTNSTIAGNGVAIQIEIEGFDLDQLLHRVRYEDNGILVRSLVAK